MDLAYKSGLIKQNMRVNGEIIKQTEEESSGTLTETSTMESGKTIKQMAMVSTCM